MTVAELRELLDNYGDHLRVLINTDPERGTLTTLDSGDTEDYDGETVVVLQVGERT